MITTLSIVLFTLSSVGSAQTAFSVDGSVIYSSNGAVGINQVAPKAEFEVASTTGPSSLVVMVSSQDGTAMMSVLGSGQANLVGGLSASSATLSASGPNVFSLTTSSGVHIVAGGIKWADGTVSTTAASTAVGVSASSLFVQEFKASGTWTRPPGVNWVTVLCAGGGGGGGGPGTGTTGSYGGGGGGAGEVVYVSTPVTNSVTVTIGNGGAGGTNSSTNGVNGSTTTFGTLVTARPGGGGKAGGNGGAGGYSYLASGGGGGYVYYPSGGTSGGAGGTAGGLGQGASGSGYGPGGVLVRTPVLNGWMFGVGGSPGPAYSYYGGGGGGGGGLSAAILSTITGTGGNGGYTGNSAPTAGATNSGSGGGGGDGRADYQGAAGGSGYCAVWWFQ
jgi:hypothetical protein